MFIPQSLLKFTYIFFTIFILFSCKEKNCFSDPITHKCMLQDQNNIILKTPNHELLAVKLAITNKEQSKGLSGIKNENFAPNQGMLFLYHWPFPWHTN